MNIFTRILFNAVLSSVFVLAFSGCSKEDSNPVATTDDSDKYMWVHFNNDSTKISFKDLPKFSADGEEAIQLNSFIDTSLIHMFVNNSGTYDSRSLYSYQVVGDDGFSASGSKGYPNNIWDHLFLGHIITSNRQIIFPDNKIDLPGAYNVKTARHIYIHRKFDLGFTDSAHFVDLNKITPVQILNPDNVLENAIPLKDVVITNVSNPNIYTYNIRSLDDFGPTTDMTYAQFQTGYWFLNSQVTKFTDTTLVGGRYKLKVLEKILIK
jgi:hypothetical protein